MALVAVMTALIVLSAIAVTMAVSIQTEARIDSIDFDSLQAEQLARSGQEFARFLQTRNLTTGANLMAGLPFEASTPGFHYRAQTATGTIDIYFESDDGRINPQTAPPELLNNFFVLWTADAARAQIITDSIADWSDRDDDARPNGAESAFYAGSNVRPRNAPMGIADLPFIRGMTAGDFQPRVSRSEAKTSIRSSTVSYFTEAAPSAAINLNFAPELVLRAIPGFNPELAAAVVAARRSRPFADMNAVQARTGLGPDSPSWRYITVAKAAPTVLAIAKLKVSGLTRSERQIVYTFNQLNVLTGSTEQRPALGRIERNVFPDFVQ